MNMTQPKILIVDDETGPREALRMILKEKYDLAFAVNGRLAVEHVKTYPTDLVIMDMKMPEMDGITALKIIKEIQPEISVLMVTGYGTVDTAVEAMKIGAYDFICKPFDTKEIIERIEQGLRHKQHALRTERMIKDLQEAAERLKEQQEALQAQILELSKLSYVGMMAQGLAHNLSSPLLIILGKAELMKEKLVNLREELVKLSMDHQVMEFNTLLKEYDQNIKDTEIIIENVAKLTEIVRNMMQKTRYEQVPHPQLLNLSEVLEEELKFLEADLYFKHNIEKHYQLQRDIPLIKGLYSDFSQTFLNLLKNAIEAMHESGEKVLSVKTWYDNHYIYVEIGDTGCGISEEDMKKIFEPYFTTKREKDSEKGLMGLGLGLHMVKTLMQPYEVKIKVKSRPGETVFTLCVPYGQYAGQGELT